ncbi:pheromone-processing carboxypeptidase KEX1 isoform X2 [Eutrema salsugineum]|nr:pheromone-processing carboxypeptidase KEX1 isoform X2 [Eutrema salsugineum]
MYIEDTFHGNHHRSDVVYQDYDEDGDDGDFRVKDDGEDGGDDDDDDDDSSDNRSDDSMTSDASSWPSTQLPRNTKNHAAAAKNSNAKQVNHQTKNRACEKFSDQEEESELKARTRTTANSRVQSRGKVSKTK